MELIEDYKKYKWFFTSSGKLVIGGKSAVQNDELLKRIKSLDKDFVIMHTAEPGSPFSIILSDINKVIKEDIKECAIFTGCFSRAWRSGKKKAIVDVFKVSKINKLKSMKTGTWGVIGKIQKLAVNLELVLTRQKGILRAVPEASVKSDKEKLIKVCPGKIDKKDMLSKLQMEVDETFSSDEVLSALPAGGAKICRK